jgi:c-di-GMP-binding flagellar brake protein YcgR
MTTSEDPGTERRQFVRYQLKATADVVFDNRVKEQGEIDNISTGGMFLRLDNEVPKKLLDKKVHASINAISSGQEVTIEAECSIVRITSDGVALYFSSMDSSNRQLLRDLIHELYDMVHESRKTS